MGDLNSHSVTAQHALGQLASTEERKPLCDGDVYDFSSPDPKAYQFAVDPEVQRMLAQKANSPVPAPRHDRERDDIASHMRASKNEYKPGVRYAPAVQAKALAKPLPDNIEHTRYEKKKNRDYAFLDSKSKTTSKKSQVNKEAMTQVAENKPAASPISNASKHGVAAMQSTTHYHLFKFFDTNRTPDKRHINTLIRSIKKKNLLHLNPIVVDANMYVIDGQHRLAAAKALKLPVYYTQDEQVTQDDIAAMNVNKKNWSGGDYINFYAKKGVPEYEKFAAFQAKHPEHSQSVLLALVASNGKRNSFAIRDGQLDIGNIDKAELQLEMLNDFKALCTVAYTTRFVEAFAYVTMHPEYDHHRMMQKVNQNPGALVPCTNKKQYIMQLQNLYNYKVMEKNIVLFLKR